MTEQRNRKKKNDFKILHKTIMSSIATAVFKVTIGLLVNKGRDKAAEKLKDGDITDQRFRGLIVREIDDIKSIHSYNLLEFKGPLPEFYKQIIRQWQKIVSTTPHSKTEILSQTIWNNKFITIDKKMVYLPLWHRAGIKQISDLFDEHENCFLPFLSLRNKYRLNCNFLQYHGLISAIPQSWKKLLHVNSDDSIATTSPPPIGTITCKTLYNRLLALENLPPPTSEKNSYLMASQRRI